VEAIGRTIRSEDSKFLILAAMIFAVAMMSVDQTIVAIAIPKIQGGLTLSDTGAQWTINAYVVALAAAFSLGGKLGDVFGHRRVAMIGTFGFAGASVLCGAAPRGGNAEAWIVVARALQGVFGALLFPAALAIVVASFAPRERGKALALFFGISGALTSVGPIMGSILLPWTWRAIFFINVPVAAIALILMARAKLTDQRRPVRIDVRGAVLVTAGMGLLVLGLQQAAQWGWGSAPTIGSLGAGAALLLAFVLVELRTTSPLIDVRIFRDGGFAADSVVVALVYACFLPLFFFASIYAELVLGYGPSATGLYALLIFGGFAAGSQIGGRMLDRRGARPAAFIGTALGAVGFALWARSLPHGVNDQWYWILLAGAGVGLALTPTSTDAINRAPRGSYGEVTGVTQTLRYFASSLALAILGTILLAQTRSHIVTSFVNQGVPRATAARIAAHFSTADNAVPVGRHAASALATIRHDFTLASQLVFYALAAVMALGFLVAARGMARGIPEQVLHPVDAEPALDQL
jgi:EmrB/QacA subfamily drug resistance transporter